MFVRRRYVHLTRDLLRAGSLGANLVSVHRRLIVHLGLWQRIFTGYILQDLFSVVVRVRSRNSCIFFRRKLISVFKVSCLNKLFFI